MSLKDLDLATTEILFRIGRHCPEALTTYMHCDIRSNNSGTVVFTKNEIDEEMSEEYQTFKSNVKKLAREDLLEWHPFGKDGSLSITLVDLENAQ